MYFGRNLRNFIISNYELSFYKININCFKSLIKFVNKVFNLINVL